MRRPIPVLLLSLCILVSCKTQEFRSGYNDANKLIHETSNLTSKPFLKAHLKNGDVLIFMNDWTVDTTRRMVAGVADRYDFNRSRQAVKQTAIAIDSVAVFETNRVPSANENKRIGALSILAGVDVIFSLFCVTNPKACFGSCPTFYINASDNFHYADAEGFSNAISPSLQYGDVDAIGNRAVAVNRFNITMKNEALETHCVDELVLLTIPTKEGQRVYQSPTDQFFRCSGASAPSSAVGPEGDITHLIRSTDHIERLSLASAKNLRSKEEIVVTFDNVDPSVDLGLLVSFRQTLMTTYFIYNAMGYMGDQVCDMFARIEAGTGTKEKLRDGLKKELGGIDAYVWLDEIKEWEAIGSFYETGPIAINHQLLPIQRHSGGKTKIKLVMNKGLWRIDRVQLTHILETVVPHEIRPSAVTSEGEPDASAVTAVSKRGEHLVSLPGEERVFSFVVPGSSERHELFLRSTGYYLEWMRAGWLKDKNLLKLRQMVERPRRYLKSEAKAYKEYERTMEEQFWNSRIDVNTFSLP